MNSSIRVTIGAGLCLAAAALAGCGSAQSREARYIRHGRQYFAAGNYDKARIEFSNAAQIDPKDGEVRYLLGQVAEKTGDLRGAFGQYQAAIGENAKLAPARAALARLFLYAGAPDKALELVEAGLTIAPNDAQLLTVRGAARQQLGNADAALRDAESAVKLAPNDEYAIALLASLYRQRSEGGKAVDVVLAGLRQLPNSVDLKSILADLYAGMAQPQLAEQQLQQIITLEPKALQHRYQLARFYLLQKNVAAAERALRDAVAAAPDLVDPKLQLVQFLAAQRGKDAAIAQADQLVAAAPANDDLKLALGQWLVQLGQLDRAESLFRAVVAHAQDKPAGLAARDRVAALRLARGDIAGARGMIAEVLKLSPRDNDALILRANMELSGTDATAAITDLRAVLRDQPNAVPVMLTLSHAYQVNGEPDQAEETLRAAVQIAPRDRNARLQLAQLLLAANKNDEAEPLLAQLAGEYPLDVAVQEALFRVQAQQKKNVDARQTALALQRSHPQQGLGYYLAGLIDEADSRDADAQRDYEQALQRQPDADDALAALVHLELRQKHPAQAMQRLDARIAAARTDGAARLLKADLLASQGRMDDALAAYRDLVGAAPDWAPAYHGLALAQIATRHTDEAIATLRDGLGKTADSGTLLTDLSTLYERLGRPDDAIALYDAQLASHPKSTFVINNLAMLLASYRTDAASLARAQQLADQLGQMSVVDVIDTRGWVKFKSGQYHEAESLLQQAVDKAPDAPELRYHLAMAQLRSGETEGAQQNLEAALRANRTFTGIAEARATLAQLQHKPASSG